MKVWTSAQGLLAAAMSKKRAASARTIYLSNFNGSAGSIDGFVDDSGITWHRLSGGTTDIDTSVKKFGASSAHIAPLNAIIYSDVVSMNNESIWNTAWTLDFWTNLTSGAQDEFYVYDGTNTYSSVTMGLSADGDMFQAAVITNDTLSQDYSSLAAITVDPGTWYHVALTFDGTTYSSYVDGTRVHSAAGAGDPPAFLNSANIRFYFLNNSGSGIHYDSLRFSNYVRWTGASFTPDAVEPTL